MELFIAFLLIVWAVWGKTIGTIVGVAKVLCWLLGVASNLITACKWGGEQVQAWRKRAAQN